VTIWLSLRSTRPPSFAPYRSSTVVPARFRVNEGVGEGLGIQGMNPQPRRVRYLSRRYPLGLQGAFGSSHRSHGFTSGFRGAHFGFSIGRSHLPPSRIGASQW
jgi:hypothetical protein